MPGFVTRVPRAAVAVSLESFALGNALLKNLPHFTQQLVVATHRGEENWLQIVFFEAQVGKRQVESQAAPKHAALNSVNNNILKSQGMKPPGVLPYSFSDLVWVSQQDLTWKEGWPPADLDLVRKLPLLMPSFQKVPAQAWTLPGTGTLLPLAPDGHSCKKLL